MAFGYSEAVKQFRADVDKYNPSIGLLMGEAGCVLWLCGDRPTRSLERHLMGIRLEGITMKDPVYVDLLTGYVHDLRMTPRYHNREDGSTAFSDFPLWDSPVAIIERSKIKCIRK